MRRVLFAVAVAAAVASVGCASKPAATAHDAEGAVEALPSWLPAYTAKQLALLSPVEQPVTVPALRVFPDLRRFGYGESHPIEHVEETFKLAKLTLSVLAHSPRFYALEEAGPEEANVVAQYGPLASVEADGFAVARRGHGGEGELAPSVQSKEARADYDHGEQLVAAHRLSQAADSFASAVVKAPNVPAARLALARAFVASGRNADAEAAFQHGIEMDATFAPFHEGLAELAEQRGDRAAARHEVAEALAYQPTSKRAIDVARRLGDGALRIPPVAIFLDVDAVGAIHMATSTSTPAQMYGGCRAVMRYEPEVRSELYEQPLDTPYYLSVMEEVVCLEAALGAYVLERSKDSKIEADPSWEQLLALAHEEGLAGYAMFEILGQHRPERARLAPQTMHAAVVAYVERHVLGETAPPEGVYSASR